VLALGVSAAALWLLWPQPSLDAELTADVWQPRPVVAPPAPSLIEAPNAELAAAASAEPEPELVLRAELLAARGECVAAQEAARKARAAGVHPSRLARVAACRDPQPP
jgi:hypothetical protein